MPAQKSWPTSRATRPVQASSSVSRKSAGLPPSWGQYTDLDEAQKAKVEALISRDDLRAFSAQYLETAKRLQEESKKRKDASDDPMQQLDFEFVLFDSALIDYDYIMTLIARFSDQPPSRQKITREQLMGLLASSAG